MDWSKLELRKRVCPPGAPEGVKFDLFPFGFFLMIRLRDKDGSARRAVKQGISQFRAIRAGEFLLFLARFGMLPWGASVFHISKAHCQRVPEPWTGRGLPLHIVMVDADSGLLRAKKIIELDPELTRRILRILAGQDANDPLLNYDIFVRRIFQTHSVSQLAVLAKLTDHIE